MKKDFRSVLTVTSSSILFSFTPIAHAAINPCQTSDIHCAYLTPTSTPITGKFIRVKNIEKNHAPTTMIFCAKPNQPLMNIPQNAKNQYLANAQIQWEFSQCMDEDCSASQPLLNDKFTITQNKITTTSIPNQTSQISLDPNYGASCQPENKSTIAALKEFATDSSLQVRLKDMEITLHKLPVVLDETLQTLEQMRHLAVKATNGPNSSSDLADLDAQFQALITYIDRIQHVNSLNGYKFITNGSLQLSFGAPSDATTVIINIPPTDIHSLSLDNIDLTSQSNAVSAQYNVEQAIKTILLLR